MAPRPVVDDLDALEQIKHGLLARGVGARAFRLHYGATATVFIEHQGRDANLGTETRTATVSNGNVTISTDGLSLVTIAVDSSTVTGATTDASSTSPQTGVDMTGIAVATAACAIAAVGVGVVLRKKLAE